MTSWWWISVLWMEMKGSGVKVPLMKLAGSSRDTLLTSMGGLYYVGSVQIGDDTFQMLFDTGSSLVWIPKSKYNGPYNDLGDTFTVHYGSGTVSGELVHVPVMLGGYSLSAFTVGLANYQQLDSFDRAEFDGIVGMAWSTDDRIKPLISQLFDAGEISENIFAMYLSPDGVSGELSIGEADTQRFTGPISWFPVVTRSWWTLALLQVSVGESTVLASGGKAIVDSGTSLILGPDDAVSRYFSMLADAGVDIRFDAGEELSYLSCAQVALLPPLLISLSPDTTFTLPGSAYVVELRQLCYIVLGSMGPIGADVDWVLGAPFLRRYYAIYDFEMGRVGLAPSGGVGGIPVVDSSGTGSVFPFFLLAILFINYL